MILSRLKSICPIVRRRQLCRAPASSALELVSASETVFRGSSCIILSPLALPRTSFITLSSAFFPLSTLPRLRYNSYFLFLFCYAPDFIWFYFILFIFCSFLYSFFYIFFYIFIIFFYYLLLLLLYYYLRIYFY